MSYDYEMTHYAFLEIFIMMKFRMTILNIILLSICIPNFYVRIQTIFSYIQKNK